MSFANPMPSDRDNSRFTMFCLTALLCGNPLPPWQCRSRGRDMRTAGRHFLQIPGPTNVPDRILRAMDMPTIDHRSPEFARLGRRVLDGMKTIFNCAGPVIIYPASG